MKQFQISEEDLCELERNLPEFAEAMFESLSPRLRTKLRKCQSILSNVRWSYGPPRNIRVIEAGESDHTL